MVDVRGAGPYLYASFQMSPSDLEGQYAQRQEKAYSLPRLRRKLGHFSKIRAHATARRDSATYGH